MSVILTVQLEFDEGEYQEFLESELVQGMPKEFLFGLLCQEHDMGFITGFSVTHGDDQEPQPDE